MVCSDSESLLTSLNSKRFFLGMCKCYFYANNKSPEAVLELLNLLITKGQNEKLLDSHFMAYYYPNIENHRFLAKILCPLNKLESLEGAQESKKQ